MTVDIAWRRFSRATIALAFLALALSLSGYLFGGGFQKAAHASATTAGAVVPGFNEYNLPPNDDGSSGTTSIGFPINFLGHTYHYLYVNTNGNVTFDSALSTYTPFGLQGTSHIIIAPFFGDVDTYWGTSTPNAQNPAGLVQYGTSTVDGRPAFGVTWPTVDCYGGNTSALNTFQLILIDRSSIGAGDFDIEFNYNQIQWEAGTASGGSSGSCLGGSSARVGFSNGSNYSFELPGSGVNGAFLDSNTSTGLIYNSRNSLVPGRYIFHIRNGVAPESGAISGTIFNNSTSTPLPNALVSICGTAGFCNNTVTSGAGTYSASGLSPDSYMIRAFPPSGSTLNTGSLGPVVLSTTTPSLTGQDIVLHGPTPPPPGTSIGPEVYTGGGGLPVIYWQQNPVNLSTTGCSGGTADYAVTLEGASTPFVSGTMTEGPSGTYTASVGQFYPHHGNAHVSMVIHCPGGSDQDNSFDMYIDPSGHVVDQFGNPIAGATVTLFRSDTAATSTSDPSFTQVPDGSSVMSIANRNNPDTTGADGSYGWDVTSGYYFVRATATDCVSATSGLAYVDSPVLTIPPAVTDLTLEMQCSAPLSTTTVTVTPSNMNGWAFFDDNGNGGTGQLVTGPGTPPLGTGSAELGVSASNQGYALGTAAFDGTKLADITQLGYSSYQPGPTLAIALQLGIHYTATSTGWQGRLVFEPYQNGQVTVGSGWQTWSPLDGIWWASGSPGNSVCPMSDPCTWSQVLANWPDASINDGLVFKAGSGWSSFTGNVDALEVGVQRAVTVYDFEPGSSAAEISGTVVDQNNQPITDATATLLWSSNSAGPFTPVGVWPGGTAQANPITTDTTGHFDWQVTPGTGYYEVSATARMCGSPTDPLVRSATSSVVSVPPDATGVTVQLVCYPVTIDSASYSPTPVPNGPAGVYTITATFTNTSQNTITHPYFTVTQLTNGNLLLNADGGPGGVGSTLTPSDATLGGDGMVSPGESVTQEFQIGLASPGPFTFLLDVSPGS